MSFINFAWYAAPARGKGIKSSLNLKPGQRGTKQLVEKCGAALLYVRYRYDAERGVRLKTVEIVVEEKPWRQRSRFRDEDLVQVMVGFSGPSGQAEKRRRKMERGG